MPVITQQMIRVYDDYTHLTLDRRDFMRKLTALSGSAAAAAAIAPMLAANSARAAIVAEDDPRVKGEPITYPGVEGQTMSAISRDRLRRAASCRRHRCTRTGLNPHIKDIARALR
jgi:carboxymethylenebutenolidase